MYVSPISLAGTNTQLRNSQPKSKSVNFCGYKEQFAEAFASHPTTRKALCYVFTILGRGAVEEKGVQLRKGNQMLAWGLDTFEERLKRIAKLPNDVLVSKDGKDIVTKAGESVNFNGERGQYITFELNSNNSITFSKNTEYESEIFRFYPDGGNLKSHKKVSGMGLAQSSKTTNYNDDGSENWFRTLFNRIFGT